MNLSIIIPVYHEEKNIEKVLQTVSKKIKTTHEVLVIYDSPKDPTYPVLKKYLKKHKTGIKIIRNTSGTGKGVMNAIKSGFSVAKGDAVVVVMADLSDDISQIDKMYKLIQQGNAVVCASRFMQGGKKIGGTWLKNLLSKTAGITLHHLLRLPTHDATNAYKMYSKKFLDSIAIESTGGFEYSLEITLKAFFKGLKITEIPTTWRDREAGKSNFQLRKWLPQYLKWYLLAVEEAFAIPLAYVLYALVTILLTALEIGAHLKDKISIVSTLDLSWQTDAVERFLHGFIAGKDYIFTYGPLFQGIFSLPAIVFHVPSYVSVPLASILLSACVAVSVLFISYSASETKTDKFLLPPILLFIVGIVPLLAENSGIRFLLPLVYACMWTRPILQKRIHLMRMIFLTLLPSFFGLYVYDLFPQMLLIGSLSILYILVRGKESIVRKIVYALSFTAGAAGFQMLTSFLLSHSLLYTQNSLTTLGDYYYVMNTVWETGKSNYLFAFPLIMVIVMAILFKSSFFSNKLKVILLILTITALTQLRTALIRSDAGHILAALYPSMFLSFILLYHFAKLKRIVAILLFILLFMLIPFRDNIYAYLSAKNVSEIAHVIKNKQQTAFLDIYSFPKEYKIYPKLFDFIAANKGKVFVYPYDSVLLNIENATYNTYAFQLYGYSNSEVEAHTVSQLRKHPPKYIILEVDGKSTLALDGIPNFTRNPLVFMWMMEHYTPASEIGQYVILQYDANKENTYAEASRDCTVWAVVGNFAYNNFFDLIKPSQFYFVFRGALRLPVKPGINTYLVIPGSNNVDMLVQLFSTHLDFSTMIENQTLESNAKVVSVNFLNQVTFYADTKMYCFK